MLRITDLREEAESVVEAVAALLIDGFGDTGAIAWPTMVEALVEVRESLEGDRISRVAFDEDGAVAGWIGGIPGYEGNACELHPLVVRRELARRGIGRALVNDLEAIAARRGMSTIYLGTDDENARTNLTGMDLYPDVLAKLANIRNLADHPFSFYERLGFSVVGVIPDANGFGRPDILMAKRVTAPSTPSAAARGPTATSTD
jgi:aminoglycoside 6'-N-acetyltransferase I